MVLELKDKWIWDFWLEQVGFKYHIFYLQADRSLGDQLLRHWNVSIGHAVSDDLIHWDVLPDALAPSADANQWDSYTTWTGSIIFHEGLWYMFYTGTNREEKGLIQRIGVATSSDLISWKKHRQNPVLEADSRWYEATKPSDWHDLAWRDPFIFKNHTSGKFHAFITGRVTTGEPYGRGVVAHATSDNLLDWAIHPPITRAGEFGHMEVPQVIYINDRYYLLFSCAGDMWSRSRVSRLNGQRHTGTYYLTAPTLTGFYEYATEATLFADEGGTLFSGKLVKAPENQWKFLAFQNNAHNGSFVGTIIDPITVTINQSGGLILEQ